jgi:hypothetical protein
MLPNGKYYIGTKKAVTIPGITLNKADGFLPYKRKSLKDNLASSM